MYEELVNAPDTRIGDSPISRLAEQLAVDPIGFDWKAPHTDRMWTNRQAQLRLYKHRFFTTGQARAHNHTCVATCPGVVAFFCSSCLSMHLSGRAARRP